MLSPHPIMSEVYLYPQFWSKWTVTSKNLGTPFSKLETEILRESRPKHHIVGYNFKFELSLRIDLISDLWGEHLIFLGQCWAGADLPGLEGNGAACLWYNNFTFIAGEPTLDPQLR